MPVDDSLHNRQTDASALVLVAPVEALEYGEHLLEVFFFESNSVILDAQFTELFPRGRTKAPGVDFHRRNGPAGLKLQSVGEQIQQKLMHLHRIGFQHRQLSALGRPDVRLHLPKHHAIASWTTPQGRQSPFVAQTIPLRVDRSRLALHAARQLVRGGRHRSDLRQPHWARAHQDDAEAPAPALAPFLAAKRAGIENGNYEAEFPLRWMQKDMHLATVSAYEAGVAMPLTNIAKEIYRLAMRDGHAAEDFSAIYEYFTHSDARSPRDTATASRAA